MIKNIVLALSICVFSALSFGFFQDAYASEPGEIPEAPPLLYKTNWLKVEILQIPKGELSKIYQGLFSERLISEIPTAEKMTPSEVIRFEKSKKSALATSMRGYNSKYHISYSEDGAFTWLFFGVSGANSPEAGVNFKFPNPDEYFAHFIVHCVEINQHCKDIANHYDKSTRAPFPGFSAGKKVIKEWFLIRSEGPCLSPGPYNKNIPIYPAFELANEISGTVMLKLTVDSCGSPIDVAIDTSSGNENFDNAAINAAWDWRIQELIGDETHKPGSYRQGIVPVRFFIPPKPTKR